MNSSNSSASFPAINLDFPINDKRNADLIYLLAYVYTVLIAALAWSIWRFVNAILSLKPKNIKLKVEKRLAQHYAERRRYRQNQVKDENPKARVKQQQSVPEAEPKPKQPKKKAIFPSEPQPKLKQPKMNASIQSENELKPKKNGSIQPKRKTSIQSQPESKQPKKMASVQSEKEQKSKNISINSEPKSKKASIQSKPDPKPKELKKKASFQMKKRHNKVK